MPEKLDSIDRAILRTLQREAKIQNVELAERVGLSPSPCLRRVRLLEEAGVIERYAALVNPAKVGLELTIFARVWVTGPDEKTIAALVDAISKLPEVVECHMLAGDYDFLLKIIVADLDAYRRSDWKNSAGSNAYATSSRTSPCRWSSRPGQCRCEPPDRRAAGMLSSDMADLTRRLVGVPILTGRKRSNKIGLHETPVVRMTACARRTP